MKWSRALCLLVVCVACNDTGLYAPCDGPGDCDPPEGEEAVCLDKDDHGFCSWTCETDEDCQNEHEDFLCASFEEASGTFCFPSCGAGEGCPDGFECRSTGGGVNQRMVCFP